MNKEDIIAMAIKSHLVMYDYDHPSLEAFAKLVAEKEREEVTKERDRMCEHCKWRNDENSTLDETNQSKVLGKS